MDKTSQAGDNVDCLSVHLSICLSHLNYNVPLIVTSLNFYYHCVIDIDKNNVHVKGQVQQSKVDVAELEKKIVSIFGIPRP